MSSDDTWQTPSMVVPFLVFDSKLSIFSGYMVASVDPVSSVVIQLGITFFLSLKARKLG